jgi:hypothetical protein
VNREKANHLVAKPDACVSFPALVLCIGMTVMPAFAGDLIAFYRFDTNAADSLGKSPPFCLTNGPGNAGVPAAFLIPNAPFSNGVLYVNGLYEPNGHRTHYLGSDPIQDLRYDSFTVSLDFYPLPQRHSRYTLSKPENWINHLTHDRYLRWRGIDPSLALVKQDNLLTGGCFYRWISLNRQSGVLNLTLNNQSLTHRFKGVAVKSGRWHNLTCSVDLRRKEILTVFDGQPLEAIRLPPDFKLAVMGSSEEASDREFTFTDYSNGSVFYGYVANLKIFGRSLAESKLTALYSASLKERPSFPERSYTWLATLLVSAMILLAVFCLCWLWLRRRRRDPSLQSF